MMTAIRNLMPATRSAGLYLWKVVLLAVVFVLMLSLSAEAAVPKVDTAVPAPISHYNFDADDNWVTIGGAKLTDSVTIKFDRDIFKVDFAGITIKKDGLGSNIAINTSGNPITITADTLTIPHEEFEANSEYEVHIPAEAVSDVNGGGDKNKAITWYFVTNKANLNGIEPEVAYLGFTPSANSTGVLKDIGNVKVQFKYPIIFNPEDNTVYHNIRVEDSFGNNHTLNSDASIADIITGELGKKTVLNIPIKSLKKGETYTVYIPLGSVRYSAGDSNNRVIFWTFTVEKQPEAESFSFEPSGITFKVGEFPLGPPNFSAGTYPSLADVEKHGTGVNKTIVIAFNDDITPGTGGLNLITISGSPSDPGINPSPSIQGNLLIIKLDRAGSSYETNILRYGTTYTLTIPSTTLADARGGSLTNSPIKFRFETSHSFDNTIVKGTVIELNNIMKKHPPRNIAVQVPKKYILEVQTIHHVKGLLPMDSSSINTQQNLTNIDITADHDAKTIRIITHRGTRDLIRNKNGIFTTGYAGLEADGLTEVTIYALDSYGKLLEKKVMKLEIDGPNPLKVYDFRMDAKLGGTHTLYDLMANSTLLNGILQHFPISQLRNIGVYFPYDW
jgi:hypothetical protein